MYENRRWVIIPVTELPNVNFAEVGETSINTVRKSVNESETFVKYQIPQPPSVVALVTKSQEYTHSEILNILSGPEWTPEED